MEKGGSTERKRDAGIYGNNIFVRRSCILREPDNYIPRIALSCAQPAAVFCPATHRHDLLLENFNTLYKVADSHQQDQRDRARISRFARITRLSENLPFARSRRSPLIPQKKFRAGLVAGTTLQLMRYTRGKLKDRAGIARVNSVTLRHNLADLTSQFV